MANATSGPITRQLGEFVSGLSLDDVPETAIGKAKEHLLDSLGCGLFGRTLDHSRRLLEALAGQDRPGATLIGGGAASDPYQAALVNGALICGFELDDVGAYVHPGSAVIPAALGAVASASHLVSGKTLLAAVIVGYEITVRISETVGFGPEKVTGWHTPGFHGSIGAAAASAKVVGLDAEATANAIAMATDLAGGGLIHARFGSDAKRLHTGRAAYTGLLCASLAQLGHVGLLDVLEDPRWGYVRAMSLPAAESGQRRDPFEIVDGLGETYDTFDRIAIKYYPVTAKGMPIIDMINRLMVGKNLQASDVAAVRIGMARFGAEQPATLMPASSLAQVNFSYPYAAAMAILHRAAPVTNSKTVLEEWIRGMEDEEVMDLQRRVSVVASEELDARNPYSVDTHVQLSTTSGKILDESSHYSRVGDSAGSIRFRQLSHEEIVGKFDNMVEASGIELKADLVTSAVSSLDKEDDAAHLLKTLNMIT